MISNYVVVIVTSSRWDEPPRIRHQLARQFARFCRVVYVQTPSEWRTKARTTIERVERNIDWVRLRNPQRLPRRLPLHIGALKRRLNVAMLREIEAALGDVPPSRRIVVNFEYSFDEVLDRSWSALGIYICNDDFAFFASGWLGRLRVRAAESVTARKARICYSVSGELRDRLLENNADSRVLLPGHDLDLTRPYPTIRREGSIRAGFMGYLDARLDYLALESVAERGIEVNLIGPVVTASKAFVRLSRHPNVSLIPPRVGRELQEILESLDVLLLPYHASHYSGLSVVAAPNKLFTYIASGKPVVAMGMPGLIPFPPGVVYFGESSVDLPDAIVRAWTEDSESLQWLRRQLAAENTWDRRGDELRADIETILAEPS